MTIVMPRAEPVPITIDRDGVARVEGTRVTLDIVIGTFKDGATPEEIIYKYPSLKLADVYAVIAYYLKATDEVEAYLREREERAKQVRQENEARFDPQGIRERLLARRKPQE
jgi:uncharacterized protein (DUF433 family)